MGRSNSGKKFHFVRHPWFKQTWSTTPLTPPPKNRDHGPFTPDRPTLYSLCFIALWMSAKLLLVTKHAFAMTDSPNSFSLLSSWNHSCVVPQVQCCQILALFNYSSWFHHRIKLSGGIMGFQHKQHTWPHRCQPLPSIYVDSTSHSQW